MAVEEEAGTSLCPVCNRVCIAEIRRVVLCQHHDVRCQAEAHAACVKLSEKPAKNEPPWYCNDCKLAGLSQYPDTDTLESIKETIEPPWDWNCTVCKQQVLETDTYNICCRKCKIWNHACCEIKDAEDFTEHKIQSYEWYCLRCKPKEPSEPEMEYDAPYDDTRHDEAMRDNAMQGLYPSSPPLRYTIMSPNLETTGKRRGEDIDHDRYVIENLIPRSITIK